MIPSISALQEDLFLIFKTIENTEQNNIRKQRMYVEAIAQSCRSVTKILIHGTFNSIEEEVDFFKNKKSFFYSELYFHEELLELEINLHTLEQAEKIELINKKLLEAIAFMTCSGNRELYQYYLSGSTNLDHHYFTRNKNPKEKYSNLRNLTEWDHITSTGYDFLFAKLIAYETFSSYLRTRITKDLGDISQVRKTENAHRKTLKWTRSKIDLIELGYFVKFTNGINGGEVETKDIMDFLGKIFSVDLSNHSDIVGDIRNRKKERFKLYEEAVRNFLRYLDEEDQHLRRRIG